MARKVKTGLARTFTHEEERNRLGSTFDERGTFKVHGCFGTFSSNPLLLLNPLNPVRAVFETTYDRSILQDEDISWDRGVDFIRGDMNILEEVKRHLKGYVHIQFIAWETKIKNINGENIIPSFRFRKYSHRVRMEFTNPNDAMILKMVLA